MRSSSVNQSLSSGGIPVDPAATPVEIKGNRWNYISYLPQVSMTVTEALAGYAASEEDVIKSQTGFAMYDSQNGWMGSLTHLQPGQGYMLYRKAAGNESLQYPTLGGSLINGLRNQPQIALKGGSGQDAGGLTTANRLIAAGHLSAADQLQMPVAGNYRYASNMTVVAA